MPQVETFGNGDPLFRARAGSTKSAPVSPSTTPGSAPGGGPGKGLEKYWKILTLAGAPVGGLEALAGALQRCRGRLGGDRPAATCHQAGGMRNRCKRDAKRVARRAMVQDPTPPGRTSSLQPLSVRFLSCNSEDFPALGRALERAQAFCTNFARFSHSARTAPRTAG